MSTARSVSVFVVFIITVIHEAFFQLSTKAAFCLWCSAAAPFEGFSPRSIHVHSNHDLPLFVANGDVVVVIDVCITSPCRGQEDAHDYIGYAIAE